MKRIIEVTILSMFLFSCSEKKEITHPMKNKFTSISFTYRDKLDSFFSFRVDSNKMFFYPKTWDTIKYGIIPDTLFSYIDSSITYILNKKVFQQKVATLKDTTFFGIILIANKDTLKILQADKEISAVFLRMISPLQIFTKNDHLILNNAAMLLESEKMTIPAPLPLKTSSPYIRSY